jgi:multidrug efflux pump subunit AcrA (membrane-fusion protein)
MVDENLSRASLVAPFDALIIAGDPTQQIGAPLRHGEQLYELSPLDTFRVAVDVEQADFADVAPGQTGRLVLSSLPYDFWPVEIVRITAIAAARDGQTSFRVEADLKADSPELRERIRSELRPGMQGIVKIDAGERRHVWIWTHAMLAWARLKLWEWIP